MANHNDGSFIVVDCFCYNREVTEIYVVGRFVEDEKMGLLEDKSRIAEESFLSF